MPEQIPGPPDSLVEDYVVTWFPASVPQRSKAFADEVKAREFATTEPGVFEWNPILEHRIVMTVSEVLPL